MHQAFEIGEKLIHGMGDQSVFSFSFKRKDMAFPMKTKSSLSIEGEKVHVDSAMLFQRLIVIYRNCQQHFDTKYKTKVIVRSRRSNE